MPYETFYLRTEKPGTETAREALIQDLKEEASNQSVDPFGVGLLEEDADGNTVLSESGATTVDFVEPERWYAEKPTFDSDGQMTDSGTRGNHLIANVRTKNEQVKQVLDAAQEQDPQNPRQGQGPPDFVDIPEQAQVGKGHSHRISKPQTPERQFAKV